LISSTTHGADIYLKGVRRRAGDAEGRRPRRESLWITACRYSRERPGRLTVCKRGSDLHLCAASTRVGDGCGSGVEARKREMNGVTWAATQGGMWWPVDTTVRGDVW
jgi:hypothetical protein